MQKKLLILIGLVLSNFLYATPWEQIKQPVAGVSQVIGSASNGCVIGAQPLTLRGEGYQVIRYNRHRHYGHPHLLTYLQDLGKKAKKKGLPPLLVGDLSMPAGGRFSTAHASHQNGLDADIWLRFGPLTDEQALKPTATLMVNRSLQRVDTNVWTKQQETLIRLAASDSRVERIFLNPAIKLKLCQTVKGDRSWLHKIRPWFGHDAHLHVRLRCPPNSSYCQNGAPIPTDEGCGDDLMSWFKPRPPSTTPAKPKVIPPLPPLCQMVLSDLGK